ncbi:MAG TPA: ATP-binding protein [Verrucomicrobiae bacterium]|nr:ATP-binding protein [Verrucomicrobiae bacterium]
MTLALQIAAVKQDLGGSAARLQQFLRDFDCAFPVEWTNAVLILALMSIGMVLALFAYLNHRAKRPYFSLWTVSWMCYAGYLAAAIGLEESPNFPLLVMMRRTCIGLSALYMFWGSFYLAGHPRSLRELQFGTGMLVVWSAVAAYKVQDRFWITMPVFVLLAAAGVYTGVAYLLRRKMYHGATILGIGFLLWGVHLLVYPLSEGSKLLTTLGYLTTAVLTIMIVVGMIVEREVAIAEQNYRVLFDSASDAIFVIDLAHYRILEANTSALRLTKRSIADLVGRPFVDLCPSLQSVEATSVRMDGLKLFNAVFRPFNEVPIARGDGTMVNCEGDASLVQWRQRLALQVNVTDVSERKKAGEQLRRAEKLSALGQLIAGVAHELNNPLAVVIGYAQVLAEKSGLDAETRQDIERIHHESDRASRIVRDLLSFARPTEPQKKVVDMNRLVASVLETQEANLRAANVHLDQHLDDKVPTTMADPTQIEQVLVNLIGNAIHALGSRTNSRTLTVRTEENGNYMRVIVADNGPGIPPDVLPKIFDPFFTTKPLGKGTGLGLTITNTIIQEHRGKILVENQPMGGAKFTVELPVVVSTAPIMPERLPPEAESAPQAPLKRSILVVDDEPGVTSLLTRVMTKNGYEVAIAMNGEEALAKLSGRSYDVILSDIRMPGMDGRKFYETLKRQDQALAHRIIFVTGDTVSPDTQAFFQETGNRWLSKPFNIAQVTTVVNEVYEKKQAVAV